MRRRCQAFELAASEPPPPRGTSNSERAQAVKGGEKGGSSTQTYYIQIRFSPSPPACAPPLSGARASASRTRLSSPHRRCRRPTLAGAYFRLSRLRFALAEPPATPGEGESARVAAADAVGIVASSVAGGERSPTAASYPPTVASVAPAFAVAPPLASTLTSGEGGGGYFEYFELEN